MENNSGFLLIDKPAGITSHDVVDKLRRITGIKKIGHAGTLDPFATGLLILAVQREATKQISNFVGMDKVYEATFVIGATTETLDSESEVSEHENKGPWTKEEIETQIKKLTGPIEQIPPMFSAIKKGGKKLYELARAGKTIEREPRTITIHEFKLLDDPIEKNGLTEIKVQINCSSGTYIRALARDLGEALGSSGYVTELTRISIGSYLLENSAQIADLSEDNWTEHLMHVNL